MGCPESPPDRGVDLSSLAGWHGGGAEPARVEIRISGTVQGVGFRPFVHGLAEQHRLAGMVRNTADGVALEVEGTPAALAGFAGALGAPPPAARIESLRWRGIPAAGGHGFAIQPSESGSAGAVAPPDLAPCLECLRELRDPSDRRYRYPFLSCARCGPRFTLIDSLPYDRERTSMRAFPLCEGCRREYADPRDRRFHAQPVACPICGPRLVAYRGDASLAEDDSFRAAAGALRDGGILALKGVGGFHLACDARREAAVALLRERKRRPEKPLAVLVPSLAAARRLTWLSAAEETALASPERPVVLVSPKARSGIAPSVRMGSPWLGIFLPPSPLHELLADAAGGAPLVMTSANVSDDPIARETGDLGALADFTLDHDRAIVARCDDSVVRVHASRATVLRRGRGFAPSPLRSPVIAARPLLAAGGQQKASFTLAAGSRFHLSQHLGELSSWRAFEAYSGEIARFEELLGLRPRALAHDLHPDYQSTHWALERAAREGLPCLPVQHHHAHFAACLAENCVTGPAIGVVFDGTGYGSDGTLWGGEVLTGDYRSFERAARIRPLALPGGSAAIREPWRTAAAWLVDAGIDPAALGGEWEERAASVRKLLGVVSPRASSAGRLFDAFTCLLTGRARAGFEGQLAVELEGLAAIGGAAGAYPFPVEEAPLLEIDTRELAHAWDADRRRGESAPHMAARFHEGLALSVAAVCRRVRERTGLGKVALSGGVFGNAILAVSARRHLEQSGFEVFCHSLVPPNDGGISFGQAVVAAARLQET